jgi:predicted transglutaminase-like cysteine proteinase
MVIGGAPVFAFPNVGSSLYDAIQKQNSKTDKPAGLDGFSFGILGSVEFKTVNHRFQSQWEGLLARIKDETGLYERCSTSARDCTPKMREWRELIASLKGQPVKVQLATLNKTINQMVTYADDKEIFGKQDYWATPSEFFKGKGDCEDFAAVKFWSLLELGFSNDQLRMAIVRDTRRKIMHAVVTVETGGKSYILDSLFDHPVEQKYVLKYSPLYSANLNSQWLHIVTRKIRVSYLNSLENGGKAKVFQVKNKQRSLPVFQPARGAASQAAATSSTEFVDWT